MKPTTQTGRTSTIRRLTILFITIEVVLLAVVSLLIYRYGWNEEKAEAAAREETMQQSTEQIRTVLQAVSQMTENLASDSRLSQIAYHSYLNEYDRSRIILGVISNLKNMQDLNPSIQDVKVSFPADNLELSSGSGYNRFGTYVPPADSEIKLTEFLYFDEGGLKMRIFYPLITSVTGKDPDYAVEVDFAESFLDPYLALYGEEAGTAVQLTAQSGEEIYFKEPAVKPDVTKNYRFMQKQVKGYPLILITWRKTGLLSANMLQTILIIAGVVVVTSLLMLLMLWRSNRDLAKPLRKLMQAFDQVKTGDLSTRIEHHHNDEFHFIYNSFNEMTQRNEDLIEDIKEQHNLLQNAELMQLQAQIDPHFLYNSFTIIKYMADGEEYEQITEFVSSLAEYYRFINKETRQNIPLSAEVRHMDTYVYIQQMRFESRIAVNEGRLPEEAAGFMVPKLILQPLVENCYKHGLKNKLEDGVITVQYALDGLRLTISVEDNGGEMTPALLEDLKRRIYVTDDSQIRHALTNTRRRLELAYGDPDMVQLSINEENGLCVALLFDLTKAPRE